MYRKPSPPIVMAIGFTGSLCPRCGPLSNRLYVWPPYLTRRGVLENGCERDVRGWFGGSVEGLGRRKEDGRREWMNARGRGRSMLVDLHG